MKSILAAVFAIATVVLVSGCASNSSGSASSNAASTGSGVTVFGTLDAGVSGYSTRSSDKR